MMPVGIRDMYSEYDVVESVYTYCVLRALQQVESVYKISKC